MASASSFNAALAVLLAVKYCRQNPLFHWKEEALPSMGRRAMKYCFRVDMLNLQQERCGEMLLALLPSQLSLLNCQKDNILYRLKALLVTLKHPYILPVLDLYYSKDKKALLVVQPFVSTGSLKDRIFNVDDPTKPYDVKYRPENGRPLPFIEIATISRQILEALAGLRSKGFVFDHLSSSNVILDQGNAKLTELYMSVLAIDRYKDSRDLTVSLEQSMDMDILLFGHILYEMATGREFMATQPDKSVLQMLAPEIAEVLCAIFYEPHLLTSPKENSNAEGDSHCTDRKRQYTNFFIVDVEKMVANFALLTLAINVPPIQSLFAGFRLDSSMKSTIKHSMQINASRTQAHLVHFQDQQLLLRARQRAERRIYEEKEKQHQKRQHFTLQKALTSQGNACTRNTTLSRRKSYRNTRFLDLVARNSVKKRVPEVRTETLEL
ncbi:uncharacterized protein CCR75_006190 [Bremia lactucae]|uniref:Protein kinase domain-containing protein n=1 Tax=Bremia lactucae TaxID=4779 RepID=A0A976FGH6_BRELC|nr:hypothetical protein CCR75_006190 [Bremia lactucae]